VVAVYCGATPVFADIDPETMTVTAATVERQLTGRTRAIIPMHYAGPARSFDGIRELVRGRDITVIEDAAHAFGSRRDGKLAGANAEFAAFSFAPTKQIASSNGGLLLYKDGERKGLLNQLSFLGLVADTYNRTIATGVSPTQRVERIGNKYKIDDVAAAIAYAGIEELDEIVAHRGQLAERYYQNLEGFAPVQLLPRRSNDVISWYIFPIRVDENRRDGLRARLAEHNIDSTVHYPNLKEQPAFESAPGEVPVTARECRRIVSLPMHRALGEDEVDRICEVIRGYLG
jgi:perosamine synthetase